MQSLLRFTTFHFLWEVSTFMKIVMCHVLHLVAGRLIHSLSKNHDWYCSIFMSRTSALVNRYLCYQPAVASAKMTLLDGTDEYWFRIFENMKYRTSIYFSNFLRNRVLASLLFPVRLERSTSTLRAAGAQQPMQLTIIDAFY
jgi:hypothetical protein